MSAKLFKEGKLTEGIELTNSEKIIIMNAILQHSSHFEDNYFSIEAEIVASADRDEPDIYNILSRSVDYGRRYNPDNVVDSVAEYNIKRYASFPSKEYRVPDWHFEYWEDKLGKDIWNEINTFFQNEEIVKKVCKQIYDNVSENEVRKTIRDYIHKDTSNIYNESLWKRFN